jgi:hypothetical protein
MIQTFYQNGSPELQIEVLKAICGNYESQSLVDLASGCAPQTGLINFKNKTHVDSVEKNIVGDGVFIKSDVLTYLDDSIKKGEKYDVSISTDTVEHFRDNDAVLFLKMTNSISKKRIWFTPLGPYCLTEDPNDNNPDSHKSEWTPEKIQKLNIGNWGFLVFPKWHPTLGENGLGAFFFWSCDDIKNDFKRVCNELKHLNDK